MAGKQIGGDGGLPANLAGMTKSQLYDIMFQMKVVLLSFLYFPIIGYSSFSKSLNPFTDLKREQ